MKYLLRLNKGLLAKERIQKDDNCANENHLVRCRFSDTCEYYDGCVGSDDLSCNIDHCWEDTCTSTDGCDVDIICNTGDYPH